MHSGATFIILLLYAIEKTTSIEVDNANELSFLQPFYNVTIYENSRPRTYVGSPQLMGVSLASLPPTAQLKYAISKGDSDQFFTAETESIGGVAVLQIRTRTGLSDVLNRERKDRYTLSISGEVKSYHKVLSSKISSTVYVNILDVNDNLPLFHENSYSISIGEDTGLHSSILKVAAEDADVGLNGEVYFFLSDPTIDTFAVDPRSGVITVTKPLDYSVFSTYKIVIYAKDRGIKPSSYKKSSSASTEVLVKVKKVNLHPPRLQIVHLPRVVEHAHTHIYAIISVTDQDVGISGEIESLEILEGDMHKLFSITKGSEKNEYNLAVLKILDRELAPTGYNITIRATDKGYPSRSSIANIHINIADINDHKPNFIKELYEESVTEEAPPGTPVVRVAALDMDHGSNGEVIFRILVGNEDKKFRINPQTGVISTIDWLDGDTTAYYTLRVAAIDQASHSQRKQSSAKVIIRVVDANDNTPIFSTPNTEVTIDEDGAEGSYVTRVIATDADSGENGFVSYSIANLDQVPFSVDPFDGTIRTSSVLDYEAQRRVYTIKVRATDWGQPLKRETETTVKVKVRDVNDNRPVFVENMCSGWLDVDSPVGSSVMTFNAIDLDAGSKVFYKLDDSDYRGCWSLDSSTGALAISCKLRDRFELQRKKNVKIVVSATDGTHSSDKSTLVLSLIDKRSESSTNRKNAQIACQQSTILNKVNEIRSFARDNNESKEMFALLPPLYGFNKHSPEFIGSFPKKLSVPENAPIGYPVIKINATDHDRGHNGRIVFAISSGDSRSNFNIDIETGIISVWTPLDREKISEYVLAVTVYDLGIPHKQTSRNLTIEIEDMNDNSPQFEQVSYSLYLPENTRNGTSVAQLFAKDPDNGRNGQIFYELVTTVAEFELDTRTGIMYVSGNLDRERRKEYDLRVRAWDNDPSTKRSTLAKVAVTIIDVNDCPPKFGAGQNIKVNIPEDYPLGALVASMQATDDDSGSMGRIKYTIISGDEGKFRIDAETGIVRVAKELDFETRQIFNLTIQAEDQGHPSLSSKGYLLVQIIDVDENAGPPYIKEKINRASVVENLPPGTLVHKVEAVDPDGRELSYRIVGGNGTGVFSINREGEVRTLKSLNREANKGYWLTISVTDRATVPLTETCHVYVDVVDVSDNVPQTEFPVYRPLIREDAPMGTIVATLRAVDEDLSPSSIRFSIARGRQRRSQWLFTNMIGDEPPEDVFTINSNTGVITTINTLDRERQSNYDLWIAVTDGILTSHTPVFVSLDDVNDNTPQFIEKVYRFTVPTRNKSKRKIPLFRDEGNNVDKTDEWYSHTSPDISDLDQRVFRIFAVDGDVGRNGDLRYSLKSKGKKNKFKIDAVTGQVYCSRNLQPGQSFDLKAKVVDNGRPQLMSTAHILVKVVKIPNRSMHAPSIDIPTSAHVMITDSPGHVVGFINAFDLDNDTLWYAIEGGDDENRFSIGLDSGLVTLARPLKESTKRTYDLTISVTDGHEKALAKLTVQVMDFTHWLPLFSQRTYRAVLSENSKPGKVIVSLECRNQGDGKKIPSTSLYYSIVYTEGIDSARHFELDSSTGNLSLAEPLDREVASSHILTVSCRERGAFQREDLSRVVITVMDSNDHTPTFLESMIRAEVSQGAAIGSHVTTVTAIDGDEGDNGIISYSIVEGNEGGAFTIDPVLGRISLAQSLLNRDLNEYLLLIRAIDHSKIPKSSSIPVRINVRYSEESPPLWKGSKHARVIELSEWTSLGTIVGVIPVNSPMSVRYDIVGGNLGEIFEISSSSGVLTLQKPLDYESVDFFNLTIQASNLVGVSRTTWLAIRVLDENDWRPEWDTLENEGEVMDTIQPGSPVFVSPLGSNPEPLIVSATDMDSGQNGRITYSIVQRNAVNYFSVDPISGVIRVSNSLEELSGRTISFSVWARDNGHPSRECLVPAEVTIHIKKLETDPPIFEKDLFAKTLFLPILPITPVLCTNLNQLPRISNSIEYSVETGNKENIFSIDSKGCLAITKRIKEETNFNLTLNGSDGGSSVKSYVVVNIRNVDENSLKFEKQTYQANILENSRSEQNLLIVNVKGLALNDEVIYTIENPNDFFEIGPTSGVLSKNGNAVDREKQDQFVLVVRATEQRPPHRLGHTLVHINVMDVNDNEPMFVGQPYQALVSTGSKRGDIVTKVHAIDPDSGYFGMVKYELVRGSGELFNVDQNNGEIKLKQPIPNPDKTYSLTVAAFDRGSQPLSSQAHVIIRVVSVQGPIFDKAYYQETVPENKPVKTPVLSVQAASPSRGELIYTITSGNENRFFELEYNTGTNEGVSQCVVRIAAKLDYETKSQHNLTIRAQDPLTGLQSDTHATIIVGDVNDNSPVFTKKLYTANVSEAAPIGYDVLKVRAIDKDTGKGGIVRYFCETCNNFSIDAITGVISVAGKLDAETKQQHLITVMAVDSGFPILKTAVSVIINLNDFNDNRPVWAQDSYEASVSTEAKAGHMITSLSARDSDISNVNGSQLRYRIHAGDPASLFAIDKDLGLVTVTGPHLLTGGSKHTLNISASDGIHVVFTSLRISVLNSNNHAPKFEKLLYEGVVSENGAPGEYVISVLAIDKDSGMYGKITYQVLNQEKERIFRIDNDGKIFTERSLDREHISRYSIVISAQDGGGKTGFTHVNIKVTDKNDNAPIFELSEYQSNIPVDTAPNSIILKVFAKDRDEGINGQIQFSLYETGNSKASKLFYVDPSTGEISLQKTAIDLENEVYQFFVRAMDNGTPTWHSDCPVTIFLMASHERAPFSKRKYAQFFHTEDSPVGTVVTSLYQSKDTQYRLSIDSDEPKDSDQAPLFSLTDSGELIISRKLDREVKRGHQITVINETMTTPPLLDYMTISVVVMDVNDCTPQFSASLYDVTVAENTEVGSTICVVLATDEDQGNNGIVQYSLKEEKTDWIKSFISIDPHSGAITLLSTLDREELPGFSFVVIASDNGAIPRHSQVVVHVTVIDYNDNPPIFVKSNYVTNAPEDTAIGTVIVELAVSDLDDSIEKMDYFVMAGDTGSHFMVNKEGQLYVSRLLDREFEDQYTLIVTATDGKFSANTTISVYILDVNDNGPKCKDLEYNLVIPEDTKLATHIVDILSYDADEGLNARSRHVLSGENSEDFRIDKQTGQITTARQLDRETKASYELVAVVEDWEHPEWSCEVFVNIKVTDVNDNSPVFKNAPYSVFIPEDAVVNSVVVKVMASDPDLGVSQRIRYSILESNDSDYFDMDPTEGIVTLRKPLDREAKDSFRVTVEASDAGTPSFSSSTQVTVTVTDINDNPPEFLRTLKQVTVDENQPKGTEISRVMATSKDIGINADITYHIEHTTDKRYLKIHPKTGVISIDEEMDYEEVQLVVATVVATDGGDPPLSTTSLLNVTVQDVNDNEPIFTQSIYEVTVPENERIGRSIIQISANDVDSGRNGQIRYSILSGNIGDYFLLEPESGIITLSKLLDREEKALFELQVSAKDMGVPSNSQSSYVKIIVADVNDNPPVFSKANYSTIVQENRAYGYTIFRFVVTDADSEVNGPPFTWKILANEDPSSNVFSLNQDGMLKVATSYLDHKERDKYEVSIRVWDSGTPPLSADTRISVLIVEESLYPPNVFPLHVSVVSYLKPFSGGIIGKVTATDQDPYDTLEFSAVQTTHSNSDMTYFDVDKQDGTIVSITPLDSGTYPITVNVSDGKFYQLAKVSVEVFIIEEEMIENSIIVSIGPISPSKFLGHLKRIFITAISQDLRVPQDNVKLLSIQSTKPRLRHKRHVHSDLDILLSVKRKNGTYFKRQKLIDTLQRKLPRIRKSLNLDASIMETVCASTNTCSGHGTCIDTVDISSDIPISFNTKLTSLVAPKFKQVPGCECIQGFDGADCEILVNACGHRPCREFEICTPSENLARGYTCHCPKGMAGPRCDIDLSKCKEPSCHYPVSPLSFRGKGYAQYILGMPLDSSNIHISVYIRTRYSAGVVMFYSGDVDYSILEITEGYVQYRWDCGSGEGLVKMPYKKVNDNKWHFINLTREGTISMLTVDGKTTSGASPGVHDIMNVSPDKFFVGAKVSRKDKSNVTPLIEFGFVGCIDLLKVNSVLLPINIHDQSQKDQARLKRLANAKLQCPETLEPPGICGSHPCFNGGICSEKNDNYECSCSSRFTGQQCQLDLAPCSSSPCLNGGTCVVIGHKYKCQCPRNLSGARCEYGVHCYPNPCLNGGRCEEGTNEAICKCQHYTGSKCEIDINECTRNPCQNGATCLNLYGNFRCLCHANTTGEYCSEDVPPQGFSLSIKELVCLVAIVFVILMIVFICVAYQRRKWKKKRQQQNNRVKLTGHHVKNDLKSNDIAKRNSKICNVEADQLLPRPSSYSAVGGSDSVLINNLKHLADLSASEQETLELNSLSRRLSNEYHLNLSKPSGGPTLSSPKLPEKRKPWDHHNNLNESRFSPYKDMTFDPAPNLEELPRPTSPGLNSSYSDNSSAYYARSWANADLSPEQDRRLLTPQQIKKFHRFCTIVVPNQGRHKEDISLLGMQWDDYDLRGSSTMLTFGPQSGGRAPSKSSLRPPNPENDTEDEPLLKQHGTPCSPRRTRHALSPQFKATSQVNDEGHKITPNPIDMSIMENNILCSSDSSTDHNPSSSSSQELPPPPMFNIVTDSDTDTSERKISNLDPSEELFAVPDKTIIQNGTKKSTGKITSIPNDDMSNKLGSPRSRRPFHRTDFGRASDVSFLSALEEEEQVEDNPSAKENKKNHELSLENFTYEVHL